MAVDTPWLGEYIWEEHGFDGDGPRSKPLPNEVIDMFRPHQCLLCNITASNLQCVYAHYESQSHFKKVAHFMREKYNVLGTLKAKKDQFQPVECDICNVTLMRRILHLQHLDSKQHLKNMKKKGELDQSQTSMTKQSKAMNLFVNIPQPPSLPKLGEYICSLCTVTTPTKAQMELHNSGARHMKNISKLADGDLRDFFVENGNCEPILTDALTPDPPKEQQSESNLVNPFMFPYSGNSMYSQSASPSMPVNPYQTGNSPMMPQYQQYSQPYGPQYNQYPSMYPYQYPANYDYNSWSAQSYQQYPPLPDTSLPPPTYDNQVPSNMGDESTLNSPDISAPKVDQPKKKRLKSGSNSPLQIQVRETPLPDGFVTSLMDEANQDGTDNCEKSSSDEEPKENDQTKDKHGASPKYADKLLDEDEWDENKSMVVSRDDQLSEDESTFQSNDLKIPDKNKSFEIESSVRDDQPEAVDKFHKLSPSVDKETDDTLSMETIKQFTIASKPTLNRLTTFMTSEETWKEVKVKKKLAIDSESDEQDEAEVMNMTVENKRDVNNADCVENNSGGIEREESLKSPYHDSVVVNDSEQVVVNNRESGHNEEGDHNSSVTNFEKGIEDADYHNQKIESTPFEVEHFDKSELQGEQKMQLEVKTIESESELQNRLPVVKIEKTEESIDEAGKNDLNDDKARVSKVEDSNVKKVDTEKSRSRSKSSRAIRKRRSRSSSSSSSSSHGGRSRSRDSLKRRRRRSQSRSRSKDRRWRNRPNYRRNDNFNRGYNQNFRQQRYRNNYFHNRNQWNRGSNYRNYGRRDDRPFRYGREENERRRFGSRRDQYPDRRHRRRSLTRSASSSSNSKSRSRSPQRVERIKNPKIKSEEVRPVEEKKFEVTKFAENDQLVLKRGSRIDINITSVNIDENQTSMPINQSPTSSKTLSLMASNNENSIIKEKEIIAKVKPFQPISDQVHRQSVSPSRDPTPEIDNWVEADKTQNSSKRDESHHREEGEEEDVSHLLTKMIILKKKMAEEEGHIDRAHKDKSKKKRRRRSESSSSSSSSSDSSSSTSSSSASIPTDLLSRFIATMKHGNATSAHGSNSKDEEVLKKGDKKKKRKKKKKKKTKKGKKSRSDQERPSLNLSSFVNSRGLFECKLCGVTASSDISFVEHLLSENHKKIFQLIKNQQIQ